MKPLNRRNFLKNSALAVAAASLPARSWARVIGANEDIRIAVVGFGGRGKEHIEGMLNLGALASINHSLAERCGQTELSIGLLQ